MYERIDGAIYTNEWLKQVHLLLTLYWSGGICQTNFNAKLLIYEGSSFLANLCRRCGGNCRVVERLF